MQRFQGGLVCKAHRLLYNSTLGLRVIKKKRSPLHGETCAFTHDAPGSNAARCRAIPAAIASPPPLPATCLSVFFFFTLVTGPRRSLSLKLSDTRVYAPEMRARLSVSRRPASSSSHRPWSPRCFRAPGGGRGRPLRRKVKGF